MMDHRLPESAVQYLVDHLSPHYSGPDFRSILVTDENKAGNSSFFIPQSDQPLDEKGVFFIDEVPVLFPCSDRSAWYSTEENGIRFNHDILKSAFYLLSGCQEHLNYKSDVFGRFPWKESIQYRLGFTEKPVVNYYFGVILKALETFCSLNKIPFQRVQREQPVLFLSHDVDRINKYAVRNLIYAGMQLLGFKPARERFSERLKNFMVFLKGTLLFRKDPYWNFSEMLDLEKQLNISSTWYFLEKTGKDNSCYHFADQKIRDLLGSIHRRGHEIGIHGTFESSNSPEAMSEAIKRLNSASPAPVSGIRQHYLKYRVSETPDIQIRGGMAYDATLGFAEHIGFRNSYAFPFRLYDFNKQRAVNIWQIPLIAMDISLLEYMSVPVESIPSAIEPLLNEVARFKGVFSLLWHNSTLDEEVYEGINPAYQQLLFQTEKKGFIPMTGAQVISWWSRSKKTTSKKRPPEKHLLKRGE